MLAVFKTGGKQYSVKTGQILKVEKLNGNKGDSVSFNDVLIVSDSSSNTIGSPLIEGATIVAEILEQIRGKKIIVFKKRRRQNYRSTQGHRQYLTVLQIKSISLGNKKSENSKKAIDKKTSEKKTKIEASSTKKTSAKKSVIKKKSIKKVTKKTAKKKEIK